MEYTVSNNNIHIVDSYLVKKSDFKKLYEEIRQNYPSNEVMLNRSNFSLTMEWSCHNFLYMVGLFRSRTKDVDLNYPQKWFVKIAYGILGPICWLFIK